MFLEKLKRFNSRGDTIIEVMVVLAILGMAIAITYSTADNSLLDIRQSEDNAQATEYAQSQIEAMRTMLSPGSPNIFIAGPYCISQTSPYTIIPWLSATTPSAGCQVGTTPFTIKVDDLYAINPTTPMDTFEILITWPDVHGYGNDTVTLNYKLHQT